MLMLLASMNQAACWLNPGSNSNVLDCVDIVIPVSLLLQVEELRFLSDNILSVEEVLN